MLKIIMVRKEQDINIEMEDGDIKELTIDGKEIQPSEYEAYGAVIDDLFGGMAAPIIMEGFQFTMPTIPSIPAMPMIPDMPYMIEGFEIPEMPKVPNMPDFNFNYFFDENVAKLFSDSTTLTIFNPTIKGSGQHFELFGDTMWMNGSNKIIIYHGNDSTILNADQIAMQWPDDAYHIILKGDGQMNNEELQIHMEAGRAQAEQWRAQQQEWREQSRHQANQWRAEQDRMRQELRHLESGNAEDLRALELELNMLDQPQPFVYGFKSPSLSLNDQMVRDGLVKEGDEVEVQLTPGKMKINGEKMPDAIHQKYLRLYEQQQGIELTGNSKVEFTTKSKQRM